MPSKLNTLSIRLKSEVHDTLAKQAYKANLTLSNYVATILAKVLNMPEYAPKSRKPHKSMRFNSEGRKILKTNKARIVRKPKGYAPLSEAESIDAARIQQEALKELYKKALEHRRKGLVTYPSDLFRDLCLEYYNNLVDALFPSDNISGSDATQFLAHWLVCVELDLANNPQELPLETYNKIISKAKEYYIDPKNKFLDVFNEFQSNLKPGYRTAILPL